MESKYIGSYQIKSLISDGGMGTVFLGTHIKLDRLVAIKQLHTELTENSEFRDRFLNEAKILARLNHPNITAIYDLLEVNNEYFIIMEYIEGITIDKMVEGNVSSFLQDRILLIFKKILSAFDYAHRQGIIHRDIKPSNIILQSGDIPKILDFGIAKITQSDLSKTKTGTRMGTVSYMSPEQILGHNVDIRTDIYSLGVMLYQMLSNHLPYKFTTDSEYEIMDSIINKEIIDIRKYCPDADQFLINAIIKATSKDVRNRFETCEEFSEALNANDVKSSISGFNTNTSDNRNRTNNINGKEEQRTRIINNVQPVFNEAMNPQYKKKNSLLFFSGGAFIIIISVILFFLVVNQKDNETQKINSDVIVKKEEKVNQTESKTTKNSENNSATEQEIKNTVKEIVSAWESKNVDKFFSYLTYDYQYLSKQGVRRNFEERKSKAYEIFAVNQYITISISNISVTVSGNEGQVEFYQEYHSTKLNENTTKQMFLRKEGNKWKLYKELSGFK